ncbi:MAG: OmpA family protein [Treponema sp.]|nr:OmpA family protein [Treponema sp.]
MNKFLVPVILVLAGIIVISCAAAPVPVQPPAPPPPPAAPVAPAQPVVPAAAPVLGVTLSSRFFSPDGDNIDDTLTMTLSCRSEAAVSNWSFEIFEPQPPNLSFFQWSGNGNPPASLTWDGKSKSGELVQSASDYPYTFTVKNVQGTAAESKGIIAVDILVIKDGDVLRVQVPSIMFAANSGGFNGLDPQISASNQYILGRIAVTLNRFSDYKVRVEGHANVTAATPAARQKEQTEELQPLSELRAKTVMDYLVNLGVDRSRLSYVGIGGARPVAAYEDHDNWWKNRRVEFILIKQ